MNILASCHDKEGLAGFLSSFMKEGDTVYATGNTQQYLLSKGINAKGTKELSGFQELVGGRVKTLTPGVMAGILSPRDELSRKQLSDLHFPEFDMVICNLYPFAEAAKENNLESMIENIDIGGITLIRSAGKNYRYVTVICDIADYQKVSREITDSGTVSESTRMYLALKAFSTAADYDILIYNALNRSLIGMESPRDLYLSYRNGKKLRYGENPDQSAWFYTDGTQRGIANATQLNGKELSYNNILDTNSAYETVLEFDLKTTVIVKHLTPCGVSSANTLVDSYEKAFEADPESAYGFVMATNAKFDVPTASAMSKHFAEIVIAPDYETEALQILKKKKNLRILKAVFERDAGNRIRSVSNGLLLQSPMTVMPASLEKKTTIAVDPKGMEDLIFAWKVVAHARSNAIVLAKNLSTVGIGAGQTSRIRALKIAGEMAGANGKGSVLASDAFFPFSDSVEEAHRLGVSAIIQPGGSIRDEEVIKRCEELQIPLYFTNKRTFLH